MSTVVVVVVGKKVVSRVSVLSDEATPRDAIGAKQSLSSNHMSLACLAKACLPKLDMQTFSKESNASDCLPRFVCTGVPGTLALHMKCPLPMLPMRANIVKTVFKSVFVRCSSICPFPVCCGLRWVFVV